MNTAKNKYFIDIDKNLNFPLVPMLRVGAHPGRSASFSRPPFSGSSTHSRAHIHNFLCRFYAKVPPFEMIGKRYPF